MKVTVKYLGPSPARAVPGAGIVERGKTIEVDAEFADRHCVPPSWERVDKAAPKAQAKSSAKAAAKDQPEARSPSLN